jgi:hypothetical protein
LGGHPLYTYVPVNTPTTGYGIFIENMLDAEARAVQSYSAGVVFPF